MENNEMTEREMLEFAAKAYADDSVVKSLDGFEQVIGYSEEMGCDVMTIWSPLTDDGDALRLAVKLGIGFRHRAGGDGSTYPALVTVFTGSFDLTEYVSQSVDEFSATRLAITKAAAEIGKRMA